MFAIACCESESDFARGGKVDWSLLGTHCRCIVIGSLDNLTKGSSGQAIQNANLMLNEEETLGLKMAPFFP